MKLVSSLRCSPNWSATPSGYAASPEPMTLYAILPFWSFISTSFTATVHVIFGGFFITTGACAAAGRARTRASSNGLMRAVSEGLFVGVWTGSLQRWLGEG